MPGGCRFGNESRFATFMLVLAAVSGVQRRRLQRAAGIRFGLVPVGTWHEALATIRARPVQLAVVDPLLTGSGGALEIERLRVLFPSLPFILYTTLAPA